MRTIEVLKQYLFDVAVAERDCRVHNHDWNRDLGWFWDGAWVYVGQVVEVNEAIGIYPEYSQTHRAMTVGFFAFETAVACISVPACSTTKDVLLSLRGGGEFQMNLRARGNWRLARTHIENYLRAEILRKVREEMV